MGHYEWVKENFDVIVCDDKTKSIMFNAYGEQVCEICGHPFNCKSIEDFFEAVETISDYLEGEW